MGLLQMVAKAERMGLLSKNGGTSIVRRAAADHGLLSKLVADGGDEPEDEPKKPVARKKRKKKGTKAMAKTKLLEAMDLELDGDEGDEERGRAAALEFLASQRSEIDGARLNAMSEEDKVAVRLGFSSAAHMRAQHAAVVPNPGELDGRGHMPLRFEQADVSRKVKRGMVRSARAEAEEAKRAALGPHYRGGR